ncbi:MAG: WG repeat-containing protein [Pseudomonadota bacterium]
MLRRLIICLAVLWGVWAHAQELVVEPQYDNAGTFHDGLAPVQLNGLWGFIDAKGRMVVEPQYERVLSGSEGLRGVKFNEDGINRWAFLDSKGQIIGDPNARGLKRYKGGWAAYKYFDDLWYFIDTKGNRISDMGWEDIGGWEPPFAAVKAGSQWGIAHIGDFGFANPVDDPAFFTEGEAIQSISGISEESFVVQTDRGVKLLQIGKLPYQVAAAVIPIAADNAFHRRIKPMVNGLAPIQMSDGQWAMLHKRTGSLVFKGRFDEIRSMQEGFAAVKLDGLWGYINRQGKMVVPPTYDRAFDFSGGYATVRSGNLRGFLKIEDDLSISEYIPLQFEDVFRFRDGLAPVKFNGKWGFISNGEEARPKLKQSPVKALIPG